ncbi:polysaccharide deacetylase family protein [Kitasatospora sp. NPDC087315]|uniref:polysaccharide deacetylase family protein n=1 Tax=Kitasatospora sp. NPDC087315 TaxID=3364069 RepID=UPI003814B152
MPEHATPPRPSSSPSVPPRPPRPSCPSVRRRRPLITGCLAVAASLALAACGTANGALQPQPGTGAPSVPGAPSGGPPGGPSVVPAPGSDGVPVSPDSAPTPPGRPVGTPKPSAPRPVTGAATPPTASKPPVRTPSQPPTTPAAPPATGAQTPPAQPAPPASGGSAAVVRSTASGGRTVALTFDDGPGPATGQVLDLLAQYGVKATFCQIGRQAAADPAMVRRVLAAGHRLCDHTVHHPQPFAALPHDKAVYEISAAKDMIVRAGGPGTGVGWFRAPGGGFNADNERISADLGMRPLGWSVDPRDWSRPGVASIVSTVRSQLKPGGVILLHDGGGDRSQTVAALRQLIPWLIAQGYRFDFPAS